MLGGILAVVFRLALTVPAEQVLHIPYLGAAGGVLLAWVAYRLLTEETEHKDHKAGSVWHAVRLMVLADATMSLDNVLAVAAIAENTPHPGPVLIIGLTLSIPLVLLGGGIVANLLERFPWLAWVGAAVLTVTAAELVTEDVGLRGQFAWLGSAHYVVAAVLTGIVLGTAWLQLRRETCQ